MGKILFIRKMEEERKELGGRLKRAENALANKALRLDKTETVLLQNQIGFMKGYLEVLAARINYEKRKHGVKEAVCSGI